MTTATVYEPKVSNVKKVNNIENDVGEIVKDKEITLWDNATLILRRVALCGAILGTAVGANILDVKMLIRSESKGSPELGYTVSRAIIRTIEWDEGRQHDWLTSLQSANMFPLFAAKWSMKSYLKEIGSKEKAESFANSHPMVAIPNRSSYIIERP